MSDIVLHPSHLSGSLQAEPCAYYAYPALIAAALARGVSTVAPLARDKSSGDLLAALEAMGVARARREASGVVIEGGGRLEEGVDTVIDCGASSCVPAYLLPLASALGGAHFLCDPGLAKPIISLYSLVFHQCGSALGASDEGVSVGDGLKPGRYRVPPASPGSFYAAMLLALPLLDGDSHLLIDADPGAQAQIGVMLSVLSCFGIHIARPHRRLLVIPGNQRYAPCAFTVPGDWGYAAHFLTMAALGASLSISGLSSIDQQSERAMLLIARNMGVGASWQDGVLHAENRSDQVAPICVDACDCLSLVPLIAAGACGAKGITRIRGIGLLRMEASDRVEAILQCLASLGAATQSWSGELAIHGARRLRGGRVRCDGQSAGMLAVASMICEEPITLIGGTDAMASAPAFWEDFRRLGGRVEGMQPPLSSQTKGM